MDNPAILAGSVSVAYLQGLIEHLQRQGWRPTRCSPMPSSALKP